MLTYDLDKRFSLYQVIESDWFFEQKKKLFRNEDILQKTHKQIMHKIGYISNLTKIKLDIQDLKRK
jgi:hypothetical protein